jgi:hypothetical protein
LDQKNEPAFYGKRREKARTRERDNLAEKVYHGEAAGRKRINSKEMVHN